jgi:peptidoglycan hydrolase-like protein with peptidoglycan-binding domain
MTHTRIEKRSAAGRVAVLALALVTTAVGILPIPTALAQRGQTLAAGTSIRIRIDNDIRSDTSRAGDSFGATVLEAVIVNGVEFIPRGSTLAGSVVRVDAPKIVSFGKPTGVTLRVDSVTSTTGSTVNVAGTLADQSGRDFATLDNLSRGSEITFRTSRAVVLPPEFSAPGPGGGNEAGDVLSAPATVLQVQTVLRDLGYFNGDLDGRLTQPTRAAVNAFQRDQRLTATGHLDQQTLGRLGLMSDTGGEAVAVTVITAEATTQPAAHLGLRIVAQTVGPNWQVFEQHFRQRDALHVYVRATNTGRGSRVPTEKVVTLALAHEEWQGLARIVVHSAGRDIEIQSDRFSSPTAALTPAEAAALERQISTLFADYARQLGVRYDVGTGELVLTRRTYGENAIGLLFALNALASSAKLYSQIVRSTDDPGTIKGATDLFVAQANVIDRVLAEMHSGRAAGVVAAWAPIHDTFDRIDLGNADADRQSGGSR